MCCREKDAGDEPCVIYVGVNKSFIEASCTRAMVCTSGVLQCVAVCCSVLQCVAVCCSVLQCGAVCCSLKQCVAVCCRVL